jgi:hypothetical protein
MWAGSIVSYLAPMTSVGTSIVGRSAPLSQLASLASAGGIARQILDLRPAAETRHRKSCAPGIVGAWN